MSLRDLTHEKHKEAETQPFVKVLFSGKITPEFYATFLYNQHPIYNILEAFSKLHGLLDDLPDVRRAPKIWEDYRELWTSEDNNPPLVPSVEKYLNYIKHLSQTNPSLLFAHVYVRHMGDLAGGQMIAKRVPGSGSMYKFEKPDELKAAIRSKLTDDLAEEANKCFDFAIDMFKDLMQLEMEKTIKDNNESSLEHAD